MNGTMKNAGVEVSTPSDREITLKREFDAPRRMVFDALTKPELIRRWLGVRNGWSMEVCEIDLKVGGKYRYVWASEKNGTRMGMTGVYREIVKPERVVTTETFDDPWYAGEAVGTAVLVEQGGKTTLTTTVLYESKETRDGILKSGMAQGVGESYDKLAEYLASAKAEETK